jgi:short-subunit dehydrogenase
MERDQRRADVRTGYGHGGEGHIVNIASRDLFRTRGAAVDVAVSQAIVGLSESLYRELDSLGSSVGVTVVCPRPINTNITGSCRDQNSIHPCGERHTVALIEHAAVATGQK